MQMGSSMWKKLAKGLEWFFDEVIGEIGFIKAIIIIAEKNKLGRAGALNAIIDLSGGLIILVIVLAQIWKNPPFFDVMPSINKLILFIGFCLVYVLTENVWKEKIKQNKK